MKISTFTIDADFIRKYSEYYVDRLIDEFISLDLLPPIFYPEEDLPNCDTFINALRYYQDKPTPLGNYVVYPFIPRQKVSYVDFSR